MSGILSLRWQPQRIPEFDGLVARFEPATVSFTESEALKSEFWDAGEDARLREDERLCPTPWGRWTLVGRELINDALFARMQADPSKGLPLQEALASSDRKQVFCPGDPRFVLRDGVIRLAGQRDLTSAEGREQIARRSREARERIFAAEPEKSDRATVAKAGRRSELVCLEVEAGGLHLEAGPLEGLPSFVKKLAITSGSHTWPVLASNFRNRCWRVPVQPGSAPFHWSAPGHEDLLGDDLGPLTLDGLSTTEATVFRVDAAGVGRRVAEPALNPGEGYRLLIPPTLAGVALQPGRVELLPEGWRLWELEVTPGSETELRTIAERIGVKTGESAPQVRWVITPPVAYRQTPGCEGYPCFEVGSVPTLHLTAEVGFAEGDLAAFLLEGADLRSFPLPAGKEALLELGPLPAGTYIVDVLHRSTRVGPQRLPFAVVEHGPRPVSAGVRVRLRAVEHAFDAQGSLTLDDDLAALQAEDIEIKGPALWRVGVAWDDGRRWRFDPLELGSDGSLDSSELLARTRERRERSTLGDLTLDFGEFGRLVFRHERRRDRAGLRQDFARIVNERVTALAGLAGQIPLIRSLWLDPLLALLGYEIDGPSEGDLAGAPVPVTILLLRATVRQGGRIVKALRGVLLFTDQPAGLGDDRVRSFADRLCERRDVSEILLTDGVLWTRHRRGSPWRARSYDIRDLVGPAADAEFESFNYEFGV